MPDPLLQVRNLSVQYVNPNGSVREAVSKVSFDLGEGETVGLLGESGSGKTTLGLALIGLLPANARSPSGSVRLRGREMLFLSESEWQRLRGTEVSIIFQHPEMALNPVMRIVDQISEVLRAHGMWKGRRGGHQKAAALLKEVGLTDERSFSAYPHELSGGERQRVVIALALACKPSFLIADEPTSALDNSRQEEILSLLKVLRERFQLTVLFITHNPLLLSGFADRAFVMYAGRMIEESRAAQLLREPQHPYTKELLRCIPPLPGAPINGNVETRNFNHGS